ncbi:hypothetical protein PA08_0421 [Cutibacterium modestum P08]|nr:hypothetical protein PA08_0421 [Cutibacterium modestum P08]
MNPQFTFFPIGEYNPPDTQVFGGSGLGFREYVGVSPSVVGVGVKQRLGVLGHGPIVSRGRGRRNVKPTTS